MLNSRIKTLAYIATAGCTLFASSMVPASAQWWEEGANAPRRYQQNDRYDNEGSNRYDYYRRDYYRRDNYRRDYRRDDNDSYEPRRYRRFRNNRNEDDQARPPQRNTDRYYDEDWGEKPIALEGGARPYIAPVAPPRVAFRYSYPIGSVIVDTGGRSLYFVTDANSAYKYPISVGKEGFAWSGVEKVARIADWPDWYPPAEMRQRRPELPEKMSGGIKNPLGARAIYLGNTLYRIHGTNDPKSIGRAESSGCIRMLNQHAVHLGSLVHVGTEVRVVPSIAAGVVASGR